MSDMDIFFFDVVLVDTNGIDPYPDRGV